MNHIRITSLPTLLLFLTKLLIELIININTITMIMIIPYSIIIIVHKRHTRNSHIKRISTSTMSKSFIILLSNSRFNILLLFLLIVLIIKGISIRTLLIIIIIYILWSILISISSFRAYSSFSIRKFLLKFRTLVSYIQTIIILRQSKQARLRSIMTRTNFNRLLLLLLSTLLLLLLLVLLILLILLRKIKTSFPILIIRMGIKFLRAGIKLLLLVLLLLFLLSNDRSLYRFKNQNLLFMVLIPRTFNQAIIQNIRFSSTSFILMMLTMFNLSKRILLYLIPIQVPIIHFLSLARNLILSSTTPIRRILHRTSITHPTSRQKICPFSALLRLIKISR